MPAFEGKLILGFRQGVASSEPFFAINATSGEELDPAFFAATVAEVERAAHLASDAFEDYGRTTGARESAR